jgi:hypothetical protein
MINIRSSKPTEQFLEQVKQALENLYDFPYLNRHPLSPLVRPTSPLATAYAARSLPP